MLDHPHLYLDHSFSVVITDTIVLDHQDHRHLDHSFSVVITDTIVLDHQDHRQGWNKDQDDVGQREPDVQRPELGHRFGVVVPLLKKLAEIKLSVF